MTQPASHAICAQCKAPFDRSSSRAFPFCSDRCKLLDLGAWASERYIIKGKPLDDRVGEAEALPEPREQDDESLN
jgi:endogenous inhibitor of DNA gyrase (YacG/DUF329 family)